MAVVCSNKRTVHFKAVRFGFDFCGLEIWRDLQQRGMFITQLKLHNGTYVERVKKALFCHRVEAFRTPAMVPKPHMVTARRVSTLTRAHSTDSAQFRPFPSIEPNDNLSLVNPAHREVLAPCGRCIVGRSRGLWW